MGRGTQHIFKASDLNLQQSRVRIETEFEGLELFEQFLVFFTPFVFGRGILLLVVIIVDSIIVGKLFEVAKPLLVLLETEIEISALEGLVAEAFQIAGDFDNLRFGQALGVLVLRVVLVAVAGGISLALLFRGGLGGVQLAAIFALWLAHTFR